MNKIPDNVLIDEEDKVRLEAYGKWKIDRKGYCVKTTRINKKYHTIRMHRIIIDCPDNMQVDHINGNRLDNRKCNLRIVTALQNAQNKTKSKGYYYCEDTNKYRVRITHFGKQIEVGRFNTEAEAASAYLDHPLKGSIILER